MSGAAALTLASALVLAAASTAYVETRSFSCETPRLGSDKCGAPFTVHSNDIVRVNLVSSGGKDVRFCGYVGDSEVACTDFLHPGAAETYLWQNTGTSDVTMQMYAKSDENTYVHVLAQGNYRIEP